jgi:putative spermidine/putrescine transport system substrate-binding protein
MIATKKTNPQKSSLNRRTFIKRSLSAGMLCAGSGLWACKPRQRTLRVGLPGGLFQNAFDAHVFPRFTAETGIKIQSITSAHSETMTTQMLNAARHGRTPMDVAIMNPSARIRGNNESLWKPIDISKLEYFSNIDPVFIDEGPGGVNSIGTFTIYLNLVINTNHVTKDPQSWAMMWDPAYVNAIGLPAHTHGFLMDITAATFFGGSHVLWDEVSFESVMEKMAELRPNARLWFTSESIQQQALQSGEIAAGIYYHDVATILEDDGYPIRSIFPAEGGVGEHLSWVQNRYSDMDEETRAFIDFTIRPDIQGLLSRKIRVAPIVKRELTDLTDAEFYRVASDRPPIFPQSQLYVERSEWITNRYERFIRQRS